MWSKIVALAAAVAIGTATMTTGAMAFYAGGGHFGGGGGLRRSRHGNGRSAFRGNGHAWHGYGPGVGTFLDGAELMVTPAFVSLL